MKAVFQTMTDTLRTQLQMEVKTLNSKLFGKKLISTEVKDADDIDKTLGEMMNRLGSKIVTVVQETFEGFREAVNEINSKGYLAKEMSDNLDLELNKGVVFITGTSKLPGNTRQTETVMPSNQSHPGMWRRERQKEVTRDDSAINSVDMAGDEEEFKHRHVSQPHVAQPTDGESQKYEAMQDQWSSEQPLKIQKEILEIDLNEKTELLRQSEQEKEKNEKFLSDRTSALKNKQKEIDNLYNEIEELRVLYNEKKKEYEKIYKELTEAQKTIVRLDKPVKQFHPGVLKSIGQMHNTEAERLVHKLEEEIVKYRQEVTKQKERFEQKEKEFQEYKKEALHQQKQVQEKAEEELKRKDHQISQLKKEAARYKKSAEQTEEKLKEQRKETAHYRQMYEENEPLFK